MRPTTERRRHRRLDLSVPVLFTVQSKTGTGITRTGVTKDVSPGGHRLGAGHWVAAGVDRQARHPARVRARRGHRLALWRGPRGAHRAPCPGARQRAHRAVGRRRPVHGPAQRRSLHHQQPFRPALGTGLLTFVNMPPHPPCPRAEAPPLECPDVDEPSGIVDDRQHELMSLPRRYLRPQIQESRQIDVDDRTHAPWGLPDWQAPGRAPSRAAVS